MSIRHALLQHLADGAFHSGTELGRSLGVTRAAVNKAIQSWTARGIEVHSVPGRGYRLENPFIPLVAGTIQGLTGTQGIDLPIEVLAETDSTNQHLLRATGDSPRACLAEVQAAGRGRRGREWVTTPYRNILLSLRWQFDLGPAALSGLSLAAGVAVLHAIESFGVSGLSLKWPNDILLDGRKLGGLLVEVRGESEGPVLAVLGLGLNVQLAAADAARIDQPWSSLQESIPVPLDRNRLAAQLIVELVSALDRYARDGFTSFRGEWEGRHYYRDQRVWMHGPRESVEGMVTGIDERGALCLRDARGVLHTFHSGEVSLRSDAP